MSKAMALIKRKALTLDDIKDILLGHEHTPKEVSNMLLDIYDYNETSYKYDIIKFLTQKYIDMNVPLNSKMETFVGKMIIDDDLYTYDIIYRIGLLGNAVDPWESTDDSLFIRVIEYGYNDFVDYMIDNGITINYFDIITSIQSKQYDIYVKLLTVNNIDFTKHDFVDYMIALTRL